MDDDLETFNDNTDDVLSLPRATVTKLIQEMMPAGISCSKESRDLLIDCCVEFIHLVSSEANEICEKESRKTISPEHVISALQALGFDGFITNVEDALNDHKESVKGNKEKRGSKMDNCGLSPEELEKQQEELFAQARARLLVAQQQQQNNQQTASSEASKPVNSNEE